MTAAEFGKRSGRDMKQNLFWNFVPKLENVADVVKTFVRFFGILFRHHESLADFRYLFRDNA